jgi:hypothetical protein
MKPARIKNGGAPKMRTPEFSRGIALRSARARFGNAVNMLVATDECDTWSFDEIADWLRHALLENPRPVDSTGPSPLILANRPA